VIPIRDLNPSDAALCERIVAAVWRIPERISPPHFADFATHLYTIGALAGSTWARVVDDGEVRGFLFGRITGGERISTSTSGLRGTLRLVTRFAVMRGVGIGRKVRWARAVHRHEWARAAIEPPGETEVTLFAVDPSAQGLGYGRALMDEFVAACWDAGAARITVETDRESSLGLYDRYGFELVGGFRSPMDALFSGGDGDSFVYELIA